jgi:hypothetical protein
METIINKHYLHFLKFNNAVTINKYITYDMLKSQNEISISLDFPKLVNDKIMCVYWRFHNFISNIEGIGLKSSHTIDTKIRDTHYFTQIQPYHQLPELYNDFDDEKNSIYMFAWSLHCTDIFNANISYAKLNNLTISILSKDNIELNNDTSIEFVVQYELNPNNLPQNLEILELNNLSMIFDNLPTCLQIIKITKKEYSNTQINNCLPKIPFGCKIINSYEEEIQL